MAKGIYCGVGGVHQSKKIFVGVNGVHKVKKIFTGVGGTPRLAYGDGLSYIGSAPNEMTQNGGQYNVGIAASPTHLLIPNSSSTSADCFDKFFTKSQVPSSDHNYGAGGNIGKYAILSGGPGANMDAYDNVLIRYKSSNNRAYARGRVSSPNYFMIAGGINGSIVNDPPPVDLTTAIDSSLVPHAVGKLYQPLVMPIGAHIGQYILFAGGTPTDYSSNAIPNVRAWDLNLTRIDTVPSMQAKRAWVPNGISTKNYAIFCRGVSTGADAYNSNLTRFTSIASTKKDTEATCVSCDDYGFVMGGGISADAEIEIYDSNFVLTISDQQIIDTSVSPDPIYTYQAGGAKFDKYFVISGGKMYKQNGTNVASKKIYLFEY